MDFDVIFSVIGPYVPAELCRTCRCGNFQLAHSQSRHRQCVAWGESILRPRVTRHALALLTVHGVTKWGAIMANAVTGPYWYEEAIPLLPREWGVLRRNLQIVGHANSLVKPFAP